VGKNVELVGLIASGPDQAAVTRITSIERKILPGERAPESGEEALAGAWTGNVILERVPGGSDSKPGDAFPLAFATDPELEHTTGRLLDTYDIVLARLRKFNAKKRTTKVELGYSFGSGSYALTLEGAYSADWKTFSGKWTSGHVGAGTFELNFVDEKTAESK